MLRITGITRNNTHTYSDFAEANIQILRSFSVANLIRKFKHLRVFYVILLEYPSIILCINCTSIKKIHLGL